MTEKQYREDFGRLVLEHIQDALGDAEWRRLRALVADRRRWMIGAEEPDLALDISPEALVDTAISEDAIAIGRILEGPFRPIRIGEIGGESVFYLDGQGVYLWMPDEDVPITLSLWITHPAYPPGW